MELKHGYGHTVSTRGRLTTETSLYLGRTEACRLTGILTLVSTVDTRPKLGYNITAQVTLRGRLRYIQVQYKHTIPCHAITRTNPLTRFLSRFGDQTRLDIHDIINSRMVTKSLTYLVWWMDENLI
jgi:hypothetical protein